MIIVSAEVLPVNEQVMVLVQLPELAVDDIEVLIGEELSDLVDILLILQESQDSEEVGTPQLTDCDASRPGTIH